MASLAGDVQARLRAALDARLNLMAEAASVPVRWPNTRGGPPPAAGAWLVPHSGEAVAAIASLGGGAVLRGRYVIEAHAPGGTGVAAIEAAADVVLQAFPPGLVVDAGAGVLVEVTGFERAALVVAREMALLDLAVPWQVTGS
ncbi:phage tail terminator-like protein [Tistrella bauzanensis]|uniref:Phage tail terminator-like protein n=1 Tax=Tistrella arctica TaxID=3133430 RepID=A0ABU9YDD6_9PROT